MDREEWARTAWQRERERERRGENENKGREAEVCVLTGTGLQKYHKLHLSARIQASRGDNAKLKGQ